jgi:hypothetical protein
MPCGFGLYSYIFQFFALFAFVTLGFIFINIYYQSYKPKMLLGLGIAFILIFLFSAGNFYYNANKLLVKIDSTCQKPLVNN